MPLCIQNLFMKTIIYLLGLLAVIATSGCAYHHDHDRDHRGGAYDRSYRDYGRDHHDSSDYNRHDDYDRDYRR